MKVSIVTLSSVNIGNRLQNYALQTVIGKYGYEVDTTFNRAEEGHKIPKWKMKVKEILGASGIKRFRTDVVLKQKRKMRFDAFNKKYIKKGVELYFDQINPKDFEQYDIVVAGSDQIWHKWYDLPGELEYFYLNFVPQEKRVAYAPSFGFEKFPEADIELHKKGLGGMRLLSCRELSGKKLIKEITGRDVPVVPDPTLLLTPQEWRIIEKKPHYKVIPNEYMLVYFLGEQSEEYKKAIEKIARERDIKIIDIYNILCKKYYTTTPDEFIWLIDNANCICTDSFHACVFSIIFRKDFLAFKRKDSYWGAMFGRVDTLLTQFDLKQCVYTGKNQEINKCDYANIEKKLDQIKMIAADYLQDALRRNEKL